MTAKPTSHKKNLLQELGEKRQFYLKLLRLVSLEEGRSMQESTANDAIKIAKRDKPLLL